jgi:hypothetical protein
MDWKEDIGDYFASINVFRIKYLNDKLREYCKEYIQYLNEFNGITASSEGGEYVPNLGGISTIYLKIATIEEAGDKQFPFKMFCHFDGTGKLCLKYSVDIDGMALLDSSIKDKHLYQTEEITDPEKTEKEFVFQLFNNRLKQYTDLIKKKFKIE